MNRAAVLSILIALSGLPAAASVQDDLEQLQAQYRDEQVRARRLRADARDAQTEITALDRELATLRLISEGRNNKEIALELSVSVSTVKSHVGDLLEKLSASDRTQAAVKALRQGLL